MILLFLRVTSLTVGRKEFVPLYMVKKGVSREERRPVGPVDTTQVFPYPVSDLK